MSTGDLCSQTWDTYQPGCTRGLWLEGQFYTCQRTTQEGKRGLEGHGLYGIIEELAAVVYKGALREVVWQLLRGVEDVGDGEAAQKRQRGGRLSVAKVELARQDRIDGARNFHEVGGQSREKGCLEGDPEEKHWEDENWKDEGDGKTKDVPAPCAF